MKVRFAVVLFSMAVLCASAAAQDLTADDWLKKARNFTKTNPGRRQSKLTTGQ